MPDHSDVMAVLATIVDPASGQDIVSSGMVQGLVVRDGAVGFSIEVDPARGADLEPLRGAAEAAVLGLPGVSSATVVLTAHSSTPGSAPQPSPSQGTNDLNAAISPSAGQRDASRRAGPGDKPLRPPPAAPNDGRVPGVDAIIAVASGKGGVGKSTVAVNLALALAAEGKRVGLLDADVYGPSQPRLLGLGGRPSTTDGKTIIPLKKHGLSVMSIGFLIDEDQSVIWRGPMLISAITQMLHQVDWGELDCLIVDLPPGTGDVQLTLSQKATLTGAIVVSTPQDIALIDARKALDMFNKLNTRVFGIIENMSTYICRNCGHEDHVFGHGGARREAEHLGVPFLGEIPLHIDIRQLSDGGTPIVNSRPDSAEAERFRDIARQLVTALETGSATPNPDTAAAPGRS